MEQHSEVTSIKWNGEIQGSVSLNSPSSVWTALGSLDEIQKERPEILNPNIQHWPSTASRFCPSMLTAVRCWVGWERTEPSVTPLLSRGLWGVEWVPGEDEHELQAQDWILLCLQCVLRLQHSSAPLVEWGMSVRPGCSCVCKHMDLHLSSGELWSRQPHWMESQNNWEWAWVWGHVWNLIVFFFLLFVCLKNLWSQGGGKKTETRSWFYLWRGDVAAHKLSQKFRGAWNRAGCWAASQHHSCGHKGLLLETCPAGDGELRGCSSTHPTQLVKRSLLQLHTFPSALLLPERWWIC